MCWKNCADASTGMALWSKEFFADIVQRIVPV
jgi:hypothetical protein